MVGRFDARIALSDIDLGPTRATVALNTSACPARGSAASRRLKIPRILMPATLANTALLDQRPVR